MRTELQRIAIAIACGWKWFPAYNKRKKMNFLVPPKGHSVTVWRGGGLGGGDNLPDYLNSLDAIHEAVMSQGWDGMMEDQFKVQLYNVFARSPGGFRDGAQVMCRATAAQRCEAFLRTIGKWEEGP